MHWLRNNFKRAKAVLIAPQITRAGLIIGGSGGRAVVLGRNAKTGKWAGPAFYVLVTGSVGFQAGVSVSETVSLVMTEKGLDSLLSSSFKFGGDFRKVISPQRFVQRALGAGDDSVFTASGSSPEIAT